MIDAVLPLHAAPVVADAGVGVHGVGADHDRFRLPRLWQLHLYRYAADYAVDGERLTLAPGTVSLVPPDTVVDYWYRGRSEHLYVHFELPPPPPLPMPCGSSGGGDVGAGGGVGVGAGVDVRTVPVVQDAAAAVPLLTELLERAIRARTQHSAAAATATAGATASAAASASVWSVLWRIADLAEDAAVRRRHPVVDAATAYIEAHLADPMSVADVARYCGISHNQLTRLFRAHLGSTVVGYVRGRRMARAQHLLTASTLPIAAVAAAVGLPDLQAFNKTCRREFGLPPRAVRASSTEAPSARPSSLSD